MALRLGKSPSTPAASSGGGGTTSEGWEDATAEFHPESAIVSIDGPEGTGKSRLALTMPGPIAYINSDEKIQGVVQPFVQAGKSIRIATFGLTPQGSKQQVLTEAEQVWVKVQGWLHESRQWAKTTILDTGTEAWELCRYASFGELNPKGNRMDALYGPVNADFRKTLKAFRQQRKTLVVLHQSKDRYVDKIVSGKTVSINTGDQKRAGFREMGYIADVVIRTGKRIESDGRVVFTATIEKGWFNALTEGITLENEDCRLPSILGMITGTEESEWM